MKRFTLGSSSISDLEKKYVAQVLDNNFISPGPVVADVEKMCAKMHGIDHGIAIHSGQSAIHVAIQAIVESRLTKYTGTNKKPLVAVPACTYISTLAAAVLAGCDIVIVDVEIPSGNMCSQDLSKILWYQKRSGRPVDIVVPVHLYGKACSLKIKKLCEQYNTYVVEDACEATFVPNIGWGHILTTSFFSNHLISGGGGGMIMTNDAELELYCWRLINHGRSARFSNDDIHRIAEKFHFDIWGHSMKWSDVPAAIVKAQIERKEELYEARRNNAMELLRYLWALDADDHLALLPDTEDHCWMMYPIILAEDLDTSRVMKDLNDNGIEVRRMMPITNQPVVIKQFPELDLRAEYPNADLINRQGFYVGCHPELSIADMAEMAQIIDAAIRKEGKRVRA